MGSRMLLVGVLLLVAMTAGCAKLKVTRVTALKRDASQDHHIKGFRYYLSRPYVVVQDDIVISESEYFYQRPKSPGNSSGATLRSLEPPGSSARSSSGSGSGALMSRLTPREWERIKGRIKVDPGVRTVDPGVRTASYAAPLASNSTSRSGVVNLGGTDSAVSLREAASVANSLARPAASASSTVDSNVGEHLDDVMPQQEDLKTNNLRGKIQIVFLPDLDEQYAVHHKNVLAKGSYALNFQDGWELTNVNGEFDSTTVAIELFNLIDSAVNSAKDVALAGIGRQVRAAEAAATEASPTSRFPSENRIELERVVLRRLVKRGVYRINKPWEVRDGLNTHGEGLLTALGLPVVDELERTPVTSTPLLSRAIADR